MTLATQGPDPLPSSNVDGGAPRSDLEAEHRREDVRRAAWTHARRAMAGVGDVIPDRFVSTPEAELEARAEAARARREAFHASAEGRFLAALGEIDAVLAQAFSALDQARAARARDFNSERDLCRRKADDLFGLSRRMRSAALDASLAAEA